MKLFKINVDDYNFEKIEEKLIKERSIAKFIEGYNYIDYGMYSCSDSDKGCFISSRNNSIFFNIKKLTSSELYLSHPINTGIDEKVELENIYDNNESLSKVSFSLNLKDKKNTIVKSIKSTHNINNPNEIYLKNYFIADRSLTVVTQAQHHMNDLFLSKYNQLQYPKCDLSQDISILNGCSLVFSDDINSDATDYQIVTLIESDLELLEKKNLDKVDSANESYVIFSEKDIVSYDNSIENELLANNIPFSSFDPVCSEDFFYSDLTQDAADISEIGIVNKNSSKKIILQLPKVSNKIITPDCKIFFASGTTIGSGGYSVGGGLYSVDLKEENIVLKKIPLSDNNDFLGISYNPLSHETVAYSSSGNLYFFKDINSLQKGNYFRTIFLELTNENIKIEYSTNGGIVMTDFKNNLLFLGKNDEKFNIVHLDQYIADFYISKKGILIATISNIFEKEIGSAYLLSFLNYESFSLDKRKEHLINLACKSDYGRNMSFNEWNEFMGNLPYVKACDNWHTPDEKSITLRK